MLGLEMVVLLGVALLVGGLLAKRFPIAPALVLLAIGAAAGLVPEFRKAELPPEVVLLLFLPALLYWESLTTSLREIRNNLRAVVLASTALVVATAGAVAAVAHALGLPWGPAWVLGAAVAPTDATAVGVLARALPRRTVTVLRAESLINDGTALVVYGLAVGVTVGTETLDTLHVSWLFVVSYGGGALAGAIVAWLSWQLRKRLEDPVLENIAILVTPFSAFLLAESVHASGVLAVVLCGLMMSQLAPRITGAAARQQMSGFWVLATTVLSSALFVLVGLEAVTAAHNLTSSSTGEAFAYIFAVTGVVIGVRWAWLYTTPYIVRALDRRPQQRLRRVGARQRTVNAIAGFRGAVSLAAALAIPRELDNGQPFPGRDLIIVTTSGVIVLTLLQALVLPAVVRFARLPEDGSVAEELRLARTQTSDAAYEALDDLAAELGSAERVVERVRHEMDKRRKLLAADGASDDPIVQHDDQYTALQLAVLAHKRATLIQLRDEQQIDDIVLRQVQAALDIEEVRLSRSAVIE
ncbi:cation:proton antiporter family protein [Jatrophihabitans fulvus]